MISSTIRSALRSRLAVQTPRISNAMRLTPIVRPTFQQSIRSYSSEHQDETFEEFTARYVLKRGRFNALRITLLTSMLDTKRNLKMPTIYSKCKEF